MTKPEITLFLDVVSPFAYLAYYMLRHSPIFKTCEITYVPIFLGGLMKSCGNPAPITIKNKDKWINRERLRWSTQFSIPMRPDTPPGFPPLTLATQRALAALQLQSPTHLSRAFDALYAAIWSGSTPDSKWDVRDAEDLRALLARPDVLGPELAGSVLEAAGGKEAKERLARNTGEAFAVGAFGLPWFQCRSGAGEVQGFWGFDHLGQVVRFLGLDVEGDAQRGAVRALL